MGWQGGGAMPWKELEGRLSGRVVDPLAEEERGPSSRRRERGERPPVVVVPSTVPYAELHCHSNFSFLDGASHPEELVEEAVRLGLTGLAVTDHDGMQGVVRFSEAAREHGLPTVFGSELSLDLPQPQAGEPDPAGSHLLVLARGQLGYARLARVIGEANLDGGEKGRPLYDIERIAKTLDGAGVVLTGCRKGQVPRTLAAEGFDAAGRELDRLVALFGADNVVVELIDHGDPRDGDRNDALYALAAQRGLRSVATNNVHYHAPGRRRLATALAAVRARRSLDEIDPWLPAAGTAHLRSGDEMAVRFMAYPGVVAQAARLGAELAFDIKLVAPDLPPYPVPAGYTEATWLRELTYRGAAERYGPPWAHPAAYAQIEHELALIERLGYPGYFLIVYDIVHYCRENRIYCQGRGSAANSAVCYALHITNVDAVQHQLLFERFLAEERDGPPDIDVDIESDQREDVIQYVYDKYDRQHTAQVANVISYRPRSAVRDMARAFGFSPGQQDAWSKQLDRWNGIDPQDGQNEGIPEHVVDFANQVLAFPRHLGIHSGGMVICDRPVLEVCPVEWARMPGRTVLQWDKDDCAAIGLVKFDLLGLGMLSALRYAFEFLEPPGDACRGGACRGGARAEPPEVQSAEPPEVQSVSRQEDSQELDLSRMPMDDPEVYDMLCRADSVGVFQVESRAQMSTLPRLKPRTFYDIVVEVALIRPGPIQGGSVHPFIRRKNKLEAVTYPHPLMRNALEKTLGVPLFQEQMMQLAIDVAGFTATESDQLRRAMGAKRSEAKMARLKERLMTGMADRGIDPVTAEDIYQKLSAFANYGFPESHAMSFAYLVYASAWLKRYHPAAFLAALLNAQPMGFYSPQSLSDDARRHGVQVRRPDINCSAAKATLESEHAVRNGSEPGEPPSHWGRGGPAVRLGLGAVRTLGEEVAERIVAERDHGPYRDMADVARRAGLTAAQLEALATADAFACFGLDRRAALWGAGAAAQDRPDRLPGTIAGHRAPALPGMDAVDRLVADVWATGMSPDSHPLKLIRADLDQRGAVRIAQLNHGVDGDRVLVGGLVTHRQRPGTAGGVTFLSLEDETGMLNVICSPGLWVRSRRVGRTSAALLIRGRLQVAEGVINLTAERLEALAVAVRPSSRDFR
jgi:error-prone DNA polymerase